jgi:hypothetical protein
VYGKPHPALEGHTATVVRSEVWVIGGICRDFKRDGLRVEHSHTDAVAILRFARPDARVAVAC